MKKITTLFLTLTALTACGAENTDINGQRYGDSLTDVANGDDRYLPEDEKIDEVRDDRNCFPNINASFEHSNTADVIQLNGRGSIAGDEHIVGLVFASAPSSNGNNVASSQTLAGQLEPFNGLNQICLVSEGANVACVSGTPDTDGVIRGVQTTNFASIGAVDFATASICVDDNP